MYPVQRIALCVEYRGKDFNGWQAQLTPGVRTVQEALEASLNRVADHSVRLSCAGRTDAGVHACAQIVHFETSSERPLKAWVKGCNALLPEAVSVRWARQVPADFHARFSALSRRYCYVIYNNPVRSAILNGLVYSYWAKLNAENMHKAGQFLLGERDFSSFRGAGCQSNTAMRNVMALSVSRQADFVWVEVKANAFLLHMVRNIVGALLEVGDGRRSPEWISELLARKDRREAGVTAPPDGLYLAEVEYPDAFELPRTDAILPFFRP